MPDPQTPKLDFFVQGTPAPGGSKNFFPVWKRDGSLVTIERNGRIWPVIRVVDDAGKGNKEWRKVVAWQAKMAKPSSMPLIPKDTPVQVRYNFWLKRPQADTLKSGGLSSNARAFPTTIPDALKLSRSTEDALTGILWEDDSSTVSFIATKQYCRLNEPTGCRIRVYILE